MAAEDSGHYETLAREKKLAKAEAAGIDTLKSRIKADEERLKTLKALKSTGLMGRDAKTAAEYQQRIADAEESLKIHREALAGKQAARKAEQASKEARAARKAERAAEKKALAKEAALKADKAKQSKYEFRQDALNLFSVPAAKRQTLGNILNSFADKVTAQRSVSEADRAALFRQLYEAGVEIAGPADDTLQDIRDYVKTGRIYVPQEVRNEFGDDWIAFNNQAWGNRIYFTRDANDRGADAWNAELAEVFPGSFDAEETDARNMLENIVDLAEEGKAEFVSIAEMMQRNQNENGVLYSRDERALIACPCSFKGNLEIPDGVTSIGYAAFAGCEGLRAVTIPESVSTIDAFAFSGCTGLSSVALPEGMTTVESFVFYGCTGLRSVTFPKSLTAINGRAFLNCSALTRVSIPENLSFIGEGAFGACTALEGFSVQAGNSVYSVDENGVLYSRDRATLFICPAGKTGLFEIPTQVTTVKSWAFYGCSGLSAVTIPESVTYIGACAFSGCGGLTELTVPGSVSSIGNGAFSSCALLESVTICEGVTAIGYEAFDTCYALSAITIPESVTSIQEGAISSFGEKTIYGVPGSEAERYAEEHMIPFETAP